MWRGFMEESTQQITSAQRMRIFVTLVTTCVALALLSTALNTALPPLIANVTQVPIMSIMSSRSHSVRCP